MDTLSNRLFNQRVWGRGLKKSAVLGTILALLLLLSGKGQIVHAASLTVTTTDDELNADGDCSLREAIQAANTDAAVDACLAGSGADTIVVPAGTYILSIAGADEDANETGDLDLTSDVTIQGAGAATTIIDGAGLSRVFHIFSTTATISGVTIRNGFEIAGGGINNSGDLTLTDITATNNTAVNGGGIFNFNSGTVLITHSAIRENTATAGGGGIFNHQEGSVVTIDKSTISENTAWFRGGGMVNDGTVQINESTLSDNQALDTNNMGWPGEGGAVSNSGTLTITNSAINSNSAIGRGGAIINNSDGTVQVERSVLSGNQALNNVGGVGEGGAVRNHGTLTITNSTISSNSAGVSGYGGGIENLSTGSLTITGSVIAGNSAENGGGIFSRGSMSVTDTSFTGNTATCCGGAITNTKPGVAVAMIDNSTFSENSAVGGGALNNFGGDLTLIDVTVKNNTGRHGVGLSNMNSGIVSITRSTFRDNMATGHGGGILNFDGGVITIEKSMIHRNSAGEFGGGVHSGTGTVTLKGSEVNYNTARQGGGIYNSDSLSLINSVVTGNKATSGPGSGGGILNDGGAVTLTKSRVRGNRPDNCVGC